MTTETMEATEAEVETAEVAEVEDTDTPVDGQPEATTAEDSPVHAIELQHYEEIRELNRELIEATREFESSKADASAKKKFVDELGKRLSYLIARGPEFQQKLPFASSEKPVQAEAESPPAPQPDNSWRNAPVAEALSLTAKQLERLEEAGVRTIGQLEDLRGGDGLGSIRGFGQATVDKIEDQVLEWLSENRDRFGEVVSDDQDQEDEQLDDESDEDSDDTDQDGDDESDMLDEL